MDESETERVSPVLLLSDVLINYLSDIEINSSDTFSLGLVEL